MNNCILLFQFTGIDLPELAKQTEGFSGSDLKELCRNAAVYRVRDLLRAEKQQRREAAASAVTAEEDGEEFVMAEE